MYLPVTASLRQFARAVTADRLAGDELAEAVIHEAQPAGSGTAADRAALFRAFIATWREIVESEAPAKPFSIAEMVRGMGPLPSESRLVLLLSDICGFRPDEIETILSPLSRPFEDILTEGRSIVCAPRDAASAVIIEDEPLIAADLKDVLETMNIKVAALARTAEQAAQETLRHHPDIVLADFNLDGTKTGIDAIIGFQDQHSCPVVFITGYPDEVLKGESVEPDFVIVKPYRPEAVQAAVAHCLDTARYSVIDADEASGTA